MTGNLAWTPAGSDGRYRYEATVMAVVWPRSQHEAVVARWPHLAEYLGSSWDEHRRRTERLCVAAEGDGLAASLVFADLDDFDAFLASRGVTAPGEEELRAYPRPADVLDVIKPWPPDRTEPCWCGSGRKYKQCCRRHGLGSPA